MQLKKSIESLTSVTQPAVSLHLYTPPFSECRTYCERTGTGRSSGHCTYFSVRGERVDVATQCAEARARTALMRS